MLNFRNVSLRRGTRVLFEHATFSIFRGERVGLVGANGSGKSSLFALVRGELSAEAGEFERPRELVLAAVAQEIEADPRPAVEFVQDGDRELRALELKIASSEAAHDGERLGRLHGEYEAIGGYSAPSRAARLLAGLGFAGSEFTRPVATFSGGWRVRLALAQALMSRSDVLLLDEPTNHLDLDAVLWLEEWLRAYQGTLLVISHDREFLDRVVSRIIAIENGSVAVYGGNYTAFETERAARLAERAAAHARQQREIRHVEEFVRRFRAKASKARQAQSRLKWLERLERIAPAHVDSPFQFEFLAPQRLPRPMLVLDRVALSYGAHTVLSSVAMSIAPGDRVALLGRNGAGKSTLTRALAGLIEPSAGERRAAPDLAVGYFAQHQVEQLEGEHSPLWHLANQGGTALARATEAEQRAFLGGFGFSGGTVFEPVAPFSGGERARLVLALLVSRRPNLLLLDEPTNHLDLDMRHALAMALQDYEGAIVLVSHDRHLLRLVADELWLVADGGAQPFAGDLDDYARWLRAQPAASGAAPPAPKAAVDERARRRGAAEARARLAPLRTALARLEREVEGLSARAAGLATALGAADLYQGARSAELEQLLAEQVTVRRRLAEAEAAWLEAAARLEREQWPTDAPTP
jgi:ATP-binding cassette subfamily F protein 3